MAHLVDMRRTGDACLDLAEAAWAAQPTGDWPPYASILEIGCAEADWMVLAKARRLDLQLTGLDWRPCVRPAGIVLMGDVLTFEPGFQYDGIVMVSALEHIGLGHYARDKTRELDPVALDGDTETMRRCVTWLKQGGRIYLDVPYQPDGYRVVGTSHRIYDDEAIASRILVPGLVERWRGYSAMAKPMEFFERPRRPAPDAEFYVVSLVLQKAG